MLERLLEDWERKAPLQQTLWRSGSPAVKWRWETQRLEKHWKLYLSGVDGVVHDLNPAFEGGHLEQAEVRVTYVVKVHRRILPGVVLADARIPIRYDLVAQHGPVVVDALRTERSQLVPFK